MKVAEVFNLQMGKTPSRKKMEHWNTGEYDWVSIKDLGSYGRFVGRTKETISELGRIESGIKQVPANTLLMSFKLSLGKTSITTRPIYTNEAIMAFLDKGTFQFDLGYMWHQFRTKDWATGTNMAVMGETLNKKTLGSALIRLPDLRTQRMVASYLDVIQGQLEIAGKKLECLDTLVKSRFVEMFGDPATNSHNLPIERLSDLGVLERGKSKHRPRNAPELRGGPDGPYPLVQTGDIANAGLYLNTYNDTYTELGLRQSKMWPKGTLCITIAANIAQTTILAIDACFPDSVVGFTSGRTIQNVFLHYWFSFFQSILEEQAPQAAQKNINLRILSDLGVITPSIEKQQEFAAFVAEVDKSRF
ncbi:restriction endonuclease subunit S, partial [Collinsella sp. D33t1_170424_A12]|uniref:restriction endonuclease subunit S n=1 Tax=Collinsella sp. D33t1_170424_A12 TaxID=2787135 RepID=UPI00351C208A